MNIFSFNCLSIQIIDGFFYIDILMSTTILPDDSTSDCGLLSCGIGKDGAYLHLLGFELIDI